MDEEDPSYVLPVRTDDTRIADGRCMTCGGRAMYCAHVRRPDHEAMTIDEVAKAVGLPRRTVADHVKTGRCPSFEAQVKGSNTKRWIKRSDIPRYVKRILKLHPTKVLKWAETGGFGGGPTRVVA